MNVTINADDFGIHSSSTLAIAECFQRGWLDTTTAMMNMPECDEAIQLAHERRICDKVGIHINLTWGSPLTDQIKRRRLFCDSDGNFTGEFHSRLSSRLWLPKEDKIAVAEEIRAQIKAFMKAGFMLMHADSHHHVHMDASILSVVMAILKEKSFKSLRIGRNIGKRMSLCNRVYKHILNKRIVSRNLGYTDYFGSPFDAEESIDKISPGESVELMVHPTYRKGGERDVDGELCDFMRPIGEVESVMERLKCKV